MTLSKEELEETEDTQHGRFLTFALGEEVFGIEIRFVTEIIGMQPITPLPEVPNFIKGIINLRGKIIPVVDVRLKFEKETVAYNDRTCIIVVETNEITVGLIVDKVAEVLMIEDENIAGIGKDGEDVKLLLSCEKLFSDEEVRVIGEN
jgi:purine-binding chemotaxis protein CheW